MLNLAYTQHDLDRCHLTLNMNRVHPFIMGNICANFQVYLKYTLRFCIDRVQLSIGTLPTSRLWSWNSLGIILSLRVTLYKDASNDWLTWSIWPSYIIRPIHKTQPPSQALILRYPVYPLHHVAREWIESRFRPHPSHVRLNTKIRITLQIFCTKSDPYSHDRRTDIWNLTETYLACI